MALPTTRTAVVAGPDHNAVLTTLPVLPPSPGELLVQVHYVAINPVDWKLLGGPTPPGAVLAKDYAGVVAAVGDNTQGWAVGDRISGIAMGGLGNPITSGGAATYATVEADLGWHVPTNIGLDAATTYGIGGSTAAFALYHILGVPFPPAKVSPEGGAAPWIVVSGGSTQVGLYLTQWAKLSGFNVVATASPKNFPLLEKYGADKTVSYADHEAALKEIAALKPQPKIVAELAGGSSWDLSRRAVNGGRYAAVLADPEGQAEHVNYGSVFKPNATFKADAREWAAEFYTKLTGLVESGAIRPTPITVRDGLEAVPQGLEDLKAGKVSGSKLIFRVAKE